MSVDSVKVFEKTLSAKIFIILFVVAGALWLGFLLVTSKYDLFVMGFFYLIFVCAMLLGCIVLVSEKIIVTSDAVISKNFYEEQVIPFKSIQRMQVGRRGKHVVLNIFTDQSKIALNYGGVRKELISLKACIIQQIRENDPEHFNQVVVPQTQPDSFLAFIRNK